MDSALTKTRSSLQMICSRKELYEGFDAVSHAVSNRSPLPVLTHVLAVSDGTRLNLSATDGELSISLSIAARIQEPGGFTAPAKQLTELLATLPDGDAHVEVDNSGSVHIHCGQSDYRMLGLPAQNYPELPTVQDDQPFTVSQRLLRDMIKKTIVAVSTEEARPFLTGVLFTLDGETLRLVATDTHRLAVRSARVLDGVGARQAIVPARTLNEVMRLLSETELPVTILISQSHIRFQVAAPEGGNEVVLTSGLIAGQFPNYQRVIPTSPTKQLILQSAPFMRAVRRASIVAKQNSNRLNLRTDGDKLILSAESSTLGQAKEEVDLTREGDEIEIGFNCNYLLDAVTVLGEEGFRLELSEPLRPGVLRPILSDEQVAAGDEYFCVLMPMQVQWSQG